MSYQMWGLGTYHLIDNQNNGHQTKVFALSFLTKNGLEVPFKKFHDEDVVIAFFAKPEDLRYAFFSLQVLQYLIFVLKVAETVTFD